MMNKSEILPSVLTRFRLQDVVVVIVCCISVFVFQVPHSYELKASWRLNVDDSVRAGSLEGKELIPKGIIDDLDRDGTNELIISNKDALIQIYTFPSDDERKDLESLILPHLNLKAEVLLSSKDKNVHVISMTTGCVQKSQMTCVKVLVVLTHDFIVHCYNVRLKLLWKKQLTLETIDSLKVYHKESFILLTSHSLQSEEDGLVIIGSLLEDVHHFEQKLDHDHDSDFTINETTKQLLRKQRGIDPALPQDTPLKSKARTGYFVTYALSAKTGGIKWKHHSNENNLEKKELEKNLFSGHHFKLQLHHQTYHKGEVSWTQYSRSLLSSLPHHWNYPADTWIQLAFFQKDSLGKDTKTEEHSFLDSIKKSFRKSLANDPFSHPISQTPLDPNTLVIHSERGVDVLNLNTGQALCKLESSMTGTSLGDLNGDGVLDFVGTNFKPQQTSTDLPYCYAVATSGHSIPLFNGSICQPSYLFGWLEGSEESSRVELSAMSPLLVPDVHSRNGIFNHLMGHTLPRPTQGYDSIFYISNGKVTCFGSHGEFHWQAITKASWPSNKFPLKSGQTMDFVPSIKIISLQSQGLQEAIVVVGWTNLAVVSLFDGKILAEHSLPCQPINPVLTGDFNNDGWTDLVVHCKQGYLGFTILHYHGYWYTAVFVGVILVVMVAFVSLLRYIDVDDVVESKPKGPKVT